jgi:hypothetical protein
VIWFRALALLIILGDVAIFIFLFRELAKATMSLRSSNVILGTILALLATFMAGELFLGFMERLVFLYTLPLVPFFTRCIIAFVFYPLLSAKLTREEQQRTDYRMVIIGLMPISFAGLIALTIYDAKVSTDTSYSFSGYYMLSSFLAFYVVLNIQSYKEREWIGQLGAAVMDIGTLSMLLSVVAILIYGGQSIFFKVLFVTTALGVWLIDHVLRLYKEALVLSGKLADL